tara:strand:- start:269 stop:766 length:498 start_codon:yes stop_codon:yes gene_type:complete
MKNSPSFRGWFYFRMGWATYFAFVFAAINTLTVTYFLAIERYPFLTTIFPTFIQYVIIVTVIGVPLLILIGYIHYKRTTAFKSETDVMVESNPYQRRNIVNITILVELTMKLNEMMFKMAKNEKLTSKEIEEIEKLQNDMKKFTSERKFSNQKDLEFLRDRITPT